MIVRRATLEDLHPLAVLFDEYRQFYGASSNLKLSYQFLKQRFQNEESVIFIHVKDETVDNVLRTVLNGTGLTYSM